MTPTDIQHVLSDGRAVQVRRALPADGDAIIELYERLSPVSRTRRFLHAAAIDGALRDLLADTSRGPIWLAFDGSACVGEARLGENPDGCRDIAVTVADAYQQRSLGRCLARLAVEHGGRGRIRATVLPGNRPAAKLAREAGIRLEWRDGVLEGERGGSAS